MNFIEKNIQRLRALKLLIISLSKHNVNQSITEGFISETRRLIEEIVAKNDINLKRTDTQQKINTLIFNQMIQAAARNIATSGDHRQIPAYEQPVTEVLPKCKLRIGLFDNLANQAYITARALRRLGYDVDVIIQENGFDSYPLARPQWEECEVENVSLADFRPDALGWQPPDFVRYVPYDHEMHNRYADRPEAIDEVTSLYRERFGKELPKDAALVLAQHMAQWNYISAMNDYDVVVLSMSAIMFGSFSPKPTVVLPLGGDLYIRAFDQDVIGLLFRAGFRQAAHLSVPETDYFAYLDRTDANGPRSFMPLIVDTDIYCPGEEPELRAAWQAKVGGEHFLLGVCRQDWSWKGSDKLIRAFARFHATPVGTSWRLILSAWGTDLEKSRELVTQLGLDNVTLWLTMCSKPILRRRQRAADAVADQFAMEGYGASVLESLAAAKPVVMRPVPDASKHHFHTGPPPFVGATTEDDIAAALTSLTDAKVRKAAGLASRKWVEAEHGYKSIAPFYMEMCAAAASYEHGRRL